MGPVATAIYTTLSGSDTLGAVLTGGIWPVVLDREKTPGAFDDVGGPLPAAVVRDQGEDADPAGIDTAFAGFPQVWFQAAATDDGRAAVDAAWEIARGLLHRTRVTGPNGTGASLAVVGRVAVDDDPAMPGLVVGMLRLQAAGLWGVA